MASDASKVTLVLARNDRGNSRRNWHPQSLLIALIVERDESGRRISFAIRSL
jgi:hypothetical protein